MKRQSINPGRVDWSGENPGIYHFLVKPAFRFFQDYFLKGGILDGMIGFLICSLSSMSVFMRSLKVKQMRSNSKK